MNFVLWKREDWERYPEDLRPKAEDVIRVRAGRGFDLQGGRKPGKRIPGSGGRGCQLGRSGVHARRTTWGGVHRLRQRSRTRRECSEGLPGDMAAGVGLARGGRDGVVRKNDGDL